MNGRRAMLVEQIKCPACGAPIELKEGKQIFFCCYCGSKLATTESVKNQGHRFVLNKQSNFKLCCEMPKDMDRMQETLKELFEYRPNSQYMEFVEEDDEYGDAHVQIFADQKLMGYLPDKYMYDFEICMEKYDDYCIDYKITKGTDELYECEITFYWEL